VEVERLVDRRHLGHQHQQKADLGPAQQLVDGARAGEKRRQHLLEIEQERAMKKQTASFAALCIP